MHISVKQYEKNQLDREIGRFSNLDKPTALDLDRVGTVAQVQQGIEAQKLARFRRKGLRMDDDALRSERHYSSRLAPTTHPLRICSPIKTV